VEVKFEGAKGKMAERDERGKQVLIDPQTAEIISKVAELDEYGKPKIDPKTGKVVYKVNDHWFILNVKFIWKDAPKGTVDSGQQVGKLRTIR